MKKNTGLIFYSLMTLFGSEKNQSFLKHQDLGKHTFCGIKNTAFKESEKLTFHVYYSVLGIYVHAGTAEFHVQLEKFENKPVYHLIGDGNTIPSYDWIFKVRDSYHSYIDTSTLQPLKFLRNVDEGGFKMNETVSFDYEKNLATTNKGTISTPECIQDVLSAIYYTRNIDFSNVKVNDKIPFNMYLDNQIHHLYIKYLGKEKIKTRYGKFNAIKFSPLLINGTIFTGGEKMLVWATDDENKIPVRVESPILVGSIKVDMMNFYNLKNPLTSLIKK